MHRLGKEFIGSKVRNIIGIYGLIIHDQISKSDLIKCKEDRNFYYTVS